MLPTLTIAKGSGPIVLLNYHVSEEAPSDECRSLDTENSVVTDPSGTPLEAIVSPGEYCFSAKPASCAVAISPEEPDEVLSGDSITFSVHTTGTGCATPCYTWDVTGESGATIDDNGVYIAGSAGGTDEVTVIDPCNGHTTATAEVRVIQDSDYDGIPDDDEELCPLSNFEYSVYIDECDPAIENHQFDDGCTMSDLIAQCADNASNHGRFVFCVAHLSIKWKKKQLISFKNMAALVRCAARADLP